MVGDFQGGAQHGSCPRPKSGESIKLAAAPPGTRRRLWTVAAGNGSHRIHSALRMTDQSNYSENSGSRLTNALSTQDSSDCSQVRSLYGSISTFTEGCNQPPVNCPDPCWIRRKIQDRHTRSYTVVRSLQDPALVISASSYGTRVLVSGSLLVNCPGFLHHTGLVPLNPIFPLTLRSPRKEAFWM